MTKLQLALDSEWSYALAIADKVHPYVDIIEIGTPLIFREGMAAVRHLRDRFPKHVLLADLKIMDAGDEEAAIAFEAGSDLVTVLGVTQDSTIQKALNAAQRSGKQIMIDLMQVSNIVERGRHLLDLGCHYLCVHTAYDMQSTTSPLADLQQLHQTIGSAALAVAGGINMDTIDAVAALHPDIVIVGGAITRAPDPAAAAHELRERLSR